MWRKRSLPPCVLCSARPLLLCVFASRKRGRRFAEFATLLKSQRRKAGNAIIAPTATNSCPRAVSARCKACEDPFDPMPRSSAARSRTKELKRTLRQRVHELVVGPRNFSYLPQYALEREFVAVGAMIAFPTLLHCDLSNVANSAERRPLFLLVVVGSVVCRCVCVPQLHVTPLTRGLAPSNHRIGERKPRERLEVATSSTQRPLLVEPLAVVGTSQPARHPTRGRRCRWSSTITS